ncbi:hypothetical protein [Frankia sp. AvcI1]|uniref:hypothetical protein n=1 Tax=Frankia sp. AvcI1 TaxID=573496 RepID=UPI0021190D59|nr:hypothetical protein [Frankia sp. AvcI1]
MSLSEISRRSGTTSSGRPVLVKEAVRHYATDPIERSPDPKFVVGLARALGVSPELVLARFLASVEASTRAKLGLAPRPHHHAQPATLAQDMAAKIDKIPDPRIRAQIIAAIHLMIDGASLNSGSATRTAPAPGSVSAAAGRAAAAIYDHIGTGDVEAAQEILRGQRSQDPRNS